MAKAGIKTSGKDKAQNGHAIRSLDASIKAQWQPHERGPSGDGGIGNKAATALREIAADEVALKRVSTAVDKAAGLVKAMSAAEQRCVGLALASDYTLESLIARSKVVRVLGPRLGARDESRIEAIRKEMGDAAAEQFRTLLLKGKELAKAK